MIDMVRGGASDVHKLVKLLYLEVVDLLLYNL